MEAKVYNQEGKAVGTVSLPEKVFGLPWNGDLVHQVVTAMTANARGPVAATKDRGAVRGGGKKPWRQKGTGRARHGSRRSPIWVGGGVTHGPLAEKDYSRKINKKVRAKALYTVLSDKIRKGELVFMDMLQLPAPKTKDAKAILNKLSTVNGLSALGRRKNAAAVYITKRDAAVEQSFRNFGNIRLDEMRNMNPVELLQYKHVVIAHPQESIKFLEGKLESR